MRFRPFLKMGTGAPRAGGSWIATEKIHGANFVIGVRGDEVSFGKRKAWLAFEEPFFGWQLVAGELADAARAAAKTIGAPQVVFYGELFGGGYPHPEVAAFPALTPVQTGIWYAPDLRWSPFDTLVAQDDDDGGELLRFSETEEVMTGVGLTTPPVVGRGRLADLEQLPVRGATRVPALLGLPAIDGNVAEGLVLKADVRAPAAERPILKRKIPEFDETKFDEAAAWQPGFVDLPTLEAWAERMVNPARIASARSKVGVAPRAIAEEVALDVLVDLEAVFAQTWTTLDDAALDHLTALVTALALTRIPSGEPR